MEFGLLVTVVLPLFNGGKFCQKDVVQLEDCLPILPAHECPPDTEAHFCNVSQPALPHRILLVLDERAHDDRTASEG